MRQSSCFLAIMILVCGIPLAQTPGAKPAPSTAKAEAGRTWPHPIPARIRDGNNKDLFIMTLGDVETGLADGTFNPARDELTLKDGTVMKNYYRDTLGIKFYRPIDKSIFPLPPSGLCTWYYYYQDINQVEVRRNADWIAKNLKDFGAKYIQVDDGWQAETKESRHGSRDWTGVDKAFPDGMASLAAYIKSLGLTPGIWIAPHGQSNEDVVKKNPGVFMFKPDGTSASESWEGKWLVDPSVPETQKYLKDLFSMMVKWGYDYFKIDGQPTVVTEFNRARGFMKNPGEIDLLYRNTLDSIRTAIGPNRYLLGCWGLPLEGVGIMNGSRTGGDVVLSWSGFFTALGPTMRSYYLHNIVWYTDPDTMLLRPPLTLDQARVWATLQGLTGQALMSSDRLTDLSEDRVELMRRVYPAVDIRPLDLFPSPQNKRIWDLKINHLGRSYDVVGVFNFGEARPEHIYLNWKELGVADGGPVHVFDFWNREYLGAWEAGMALTVPTTSCRVLTLMPSSGNIQLVSTSRHMTQGWVDLQSLNSGPGNSFSGRSKVIKNDPYELFFAFPRDKNFAIKAATARTSAGALPVRTTNHQGWASVRIDSPATAEVSWNAVFEPADAYQYPTQAPTGLRVEPVGLNGGNLSWGAQYYLNAGYQVYLDGNLLGYSGSTVFPMRGLDPTRAYTAEVKAIWYDGTVGPRHQKSELQFTLASLLPYEILLTALEPVRTGSGGGRGGGRGGPAGGLTTGGKRYEGGISARAGAEVEYDIAGLFTTFTAAVGVDDGYDGALIFSVAGDGKELWSSGPIHKSGALSPVMVNISGVKRLVLRVTQSGAPPTAVPQGPGRGRGGAGSQGAWLEPKVAGRAVAR